MPKKRNKGIFEASFLSHGEVINVNAILRLISTCVLNDVVLNSDIFGHLNLKTLLNISPMSYRAKTPKLRPVTNRFYSNSKQFTDVKHG